MLPEHQANPSECFMAGESEFHGRKVGVSWQETRSFMAGKSKFQGRKVESCREHEFGTD